MNKIILKTFTFHKVYLQYVVNYNSEVTQQGLPNSQIQCKIKDEMGISKNDTLTTSRAIEAVRFV